MSAHALPLLDPDARLVIGHRGASAEAPENTLAAFRRAAELGVDGFEFDVRVTADGVAVVIHDPTLDRTTGRADLVAASPLARLRKADAGARFTADGGRTYPWRGRGVTIPTLGEVLDAFPAMPMIIEVKVPEAQFAVREALLRHDATARCVVAANAHAALALFHRPPFLRGASRRDIARLWLGSHLGLASAARDCRCFAVPVRHGNIHVTTDRFLAAARRLGRPVHVWTVDDPAEAASLWSRGVSGIITNAPGAMPPASERPGPHSSTATSAPQGD
jgi:glycerophosphoryl diester phosphodiesterase